MRSLKWQRGYGRLLLFASLVLILSWCSKDGGRAVASGISAIVSVFGQTGVVNIPVTTTDISTPAAPSSGKTTWYTKGGSSCAENPGGFESCGWPILPQSGWSLLNCGSQCVYNDFSPFFQDFYISSNITTTNFRSVLRALPGANYTVVMTIECVPGIPGGTLAVNATFGCGLFVSDGTKLESLFLLIQNVGANPGCSAEVATITTSSGGTTTALTGPTGNLTGCLATLKAVNDGTHRTWYYWSNTGSSGAYTQLYQEASGTFLTETEFGFGGLALEASAQAWTYQSVRVRYMTDTSP